MYIIFIGFIRLFFHEFPYKISHWAISAHAVRIIALGLLLIEINQVLCTDIN